MFATAMVAKGGWTHNPDWGQIEGAVRALRGFNDSVWIAFGRRGSITIVKWAFSPRRYLVVFNYRSRYDSAANVPKETVLTVTRAYVQEGKPPPVSRWVLNWPARTKRNNKKGYRT